MIKAVADRYLEKRLVQKDVLNNSKQLFDYLYHSMRDNRRESFKAVFLNSKNKVIRSETLSKGTLNGSSVYPREVVLEALNHHAAGVIFAHNHPSGDPTPSAEDVSITEQLIFACRLMSITVHEHIIIGDNKYFSFADQGYIAKMNRAYEKRIKP